jgi:hypothetical protein
MTDGHDRRPRPLARPWLLDVRFGGDAAYSRSHRRVAATRRGMFLAY